MGYQKKAAQIINSMIASVEKNCGTGSGGFKPGNTCGGGGGASTVAARVIEASKHTAAAGRLSAKALAATPTNMSLIQKHLDRIKDHVKYAKAAADKANKKGATDAEISAQAKEAAIHHKSARRLHDTISGLLHNGTDFDAARAHGAAATGHALAHQGWRSVMFAHHGGTQYTP